MEQNTGEKNWEKKQKVILDLFFDNLQISFFIIIYEYVFTVL